MVRKKEIDVKESTLLKFPHIEASRLLDERIQKGIQLRDNNINSWDELAVQKKELEKWDAYNAELLRKLFTTETLSDEYNRFYGLASIIDVYSTPRLSEDIKEFKERVQDDINRLDSIKERLPLFDESQDMTSSQVQEKQKRLSDDHVVFIGHGRSPLWARVKLFLEELGIAAMSFESESHAGESIVPILEEMLNQAVFAVLILTAEDATAEGTRRARQNVIHEAGLFQGRLGFTRAILLQQDGLEGFTNVDGLQYIGFSGDRVDQTFYELQRVLKREGLI